MAILFEKQKKTQKNLIFVLLLVLVITIIVVWQGFSKKETKETFEITPTFFKKEIKINFEVLKNPILEELQPFSEIEPFKEVPAKPGKPEQKLGRENPFIPY